MTGAAYVQSSVAILTESFVGGAGALHHGAKQRQRGVHVAVSSSDGRA